MRILTPSASGFVDTRLAWLFAGTRSDLRKLMTMAAADTTISGAVGREHLHQSTSANLAG
jgi:hypothetical protein